MKCALASYTSKVSYLYKSIKMKIPVKILRFTYRTIAKVDIWRLTYLYVIFCDFHWYLNYN